MLAQLLSGQVFTLSDDTCAIQQLSYILQVPMFRIHLEEYNNILYVIVQDFSIEWTLLDTKVRDIRGYNYNKYQCKVNENTYIIYKGLGGYSYNVKRAGHSDVAEVIYPVREWMNMMQIEEYLFKVNQGKIVSS